MLSVNTTASERVTMVDMLRLQATLTRQSGQLLDMLIAEQIDKLRRTAEKWDCTTPGQLRDALVLEVSQRELVAYPSMN